MSPLFSRTGKLGAKGDAKFDTEQMDAEGLGRKLLPTPL